MNLFKNTDVQLARSKEDFYIISFAPVIKLRCLSETSRSLIYAVEFFIHRSEKCCLSFMSNLDCL